MASNFATLNADMLRLLEEVRNGKSMYGGSAIGGGYEAASLLQSAPQHAPPVAPPAAPSRRAASSGGGAIGGGGAALPYQFGPAVPLVGSGMPAAAYNSAPPPPQMAPPMAPQVAPPMAPPLAAMLSRAGPRLGGGATTKTGGWNWKWAVGVAVLVGILATVLVLTLTRRSRKRAAAAAAAAPSAVRAAAPWGAPPPSSTAQRTQPHAPVYPLRPAGSAPNASPYAPTNGGYAPQHGFPPASPYGPPPPPPPPPPFMPPDEVTRYRALHLAYYKAQGLDDASAGAFIDSRLAELEAEHVARWQAAHRPTTLPPSMAPPQHPYNTHGAGSGAPPPYGQPQYAPPPPPASAGANFNDSVRIDGGIPTTDSGSGGTSGGTSGGGGVATTMPGGGGVSGTVDMAAMYGRPPPPTFDDTTAERRDTFVPSANGYIGGGMPTGMPNGVSNGMSIGRADADAAARGKVSENEVGDYLAKREAITAGRGSPYGGGPYGGPMGGGPMGVPIGVAPMGGSPMSGGMPALPAPQGGDQNFTPITALR